MFNFFKRFRTTPPAPVVPPTPEELVQQKREAFAEAVRKAVEVYSEDRLSGGLVHPRFPLEPYTPPRGIAPASAVLAADAQWKNLAQDTISVISSMSGITASVLDGMGFPGFPYLTELAQLTEYRDMSERTAAEMTRKWVKLRSVGTQDKTETITMLEEQMKRYKVRDLFRYAATIDGFMGRAQLFVNLGQTTGDELKTPLMVNPLKIKRNSLHGFKVVEPITTYPASYNASNPLASDYYAPSSWFVYGQEVHATRLLPFVSRPLPELLKPVYNFSGMSMSQLAMPYVDYWFGTRDSVGKLLRNFSITTLATDLETLLSPSGDELLRRVKLFTKMRDNQGVFLINKDKEALTQLNTPLSGLDKLQAQAQEHMAAVAKTPLVVLLGITPAGLNASSDGEIRVYYDYIADMQDRLFRQNLKTVMDVIMLDQLGYVDEDITFDFISLYELTEKDKSVIRKSDADTAAVLQQTGAISSEEIRKKIASDPDSGFDGVDLSEPLPAPTQPTDPSVTEVPVEGSATAAQTADELMKDVRRVAYDGGFRGNQHLGGFKTSDDPAATAIRLSGAAHHATRQARKLGTQRSHKAATTAHRRAEEAHQRALSLAPDGMKHVHETYIDAHKAAELAHAACGGSR